MLVLEGLLANNRDWAAARVEADPDYFARLARQQRPRYLWIGCSDSRVPATQLVGLEPGEVFVHRNVANQAPPQDANYLSVLQFAVEVLRVRHIIVTGHYGCGGVIASVDGERHGLIDHWLHPIRRIAEERRAELDAIADVTGRHDRLCELNVLRQVENVASDVFVQDAWDCGQELCVHGWIYALATGLITDLRVSVGGREEFERVFGNYSLPCPPARREGTAANPPWPG